MEPKQQGDGSPAEELLPGFFFFSLTLMENIMSSWKDAKENHKNERTKKESKCTHVRQLNYSAADVADMVLRRQASKRTSGLLRLIRSYHVDH